MGQNEQFFERLDGVLTEHHDFSHPVITWVISVSNLNGHEARKFLEDGDLLIIYDKNSVIWTGEIQQDHSQRYQTWIDAYGFKEVLWIQKGEYSLVWQEFFMPSGGGAGHKATLFKKLKLHQYYQRSEGG